MIIFFFWAWIMQGCWQYQQCSIGATGRIGFFDVYFRKPFQPLTSKSQPEELELIVKHLTNEDFVDYDGIYKRKLKSSENFETVETRYVSAILNFILRHLCSLHFRCSYNFMTSCQYGLYQVNTSKWYIPGMHTISSRINMIHT